MQGLTEPVALVQGLPVQSPLPLLVREPARWQALELVLLPYLIDLINS